MTGDDRQSWPRGFRGVKAAFADATFSSAFASGSLSTATQWTANITLIGYAFEVSNSPLMVGLVSFAQFIPVLVLGLPFGVAVDRFSRRGLLVIGAALQIIATFTGAIYIIHASGQALPLVLCAAGLGIGQALQMTTFAATLPTLLPPPALPLVVALNSGQLSLGRIAGPALGAVLLTMIGPGYTMLAVGGLFCIVLGLLFFARIPHHDRLVSADGWGGRLFAGLAVAVRIGTVRRCLLSIAVFATLGIPLVSHMPVLAASFGVSTRSPLFGILLSVFGVGALAGAIIVPFLARWLSFARITQTALGAFGGTLILLIFTEALGAAFVLLGILGVAYFMVFTSISIRLQIGLDLAIRGRVMALWVMSFGGMIPVGALIGGVIIEASSLSVLLLSSACAAILLIPFNRRRS